MGTELENSAAVTALEYFVVENEDLLALEQRIGRFNIFDALRIVDAEIRHSNFLGWLLDPSEAHNQGGLFLRAILMDLLRQSEPPQRPQGLSPITLDGGELRGVEIRREWRNIDLLIKCDEPRFVIAIENKIRSGEHSDQLERYKKIIREQFGDVPRQFVFLTPEGDEPSDDDWTVYDYRSVHDVLRRVVDANRSAIGDDVLAFIEHYLRILRSRLMDDPKIEELCRRIYQNHRQAIDLVWATVGSPESTVLRELADVLEADPRWLVLNRRGKGIDFIPASWNGGLPSIGKHEKYRANWLKWSIGIGKKQCWIGFEVVQTTSPEVRYAVVQALTAEGNPFDCQKVWLAEDTKWNRIAREKIAGWREGNEPEPAKLVDKALPMLAKWEERFAGVPDFVGPIIQRVHH